MIRFTTLSLLTLGLLVLAPLANAQQQPGRVKAFFVRGDVSLVNNVSGMEIPLRRGQEFTEGYTVVVGDDSTALLVFSNGSSMNIEPNSRLNIETFRQEPYNLNRGTYAALDADPSTSTTRLDLEQGGVVGEIRKLQASSKYTVTTPSGAAGIRGTLLYATEDEFGSLPENGDGNGDVEVTVGGETYQISESQMLTIPAGGGTPFIEPINPNDASAILAAKEINEAVGTQAENVEALLIANGSSPAEAAAAADAFAEAALAKALADTQGSAPDTLGADADASAQDAFNTVQDFINDGSPTPVQDFINQLFGETGDAPRGEVPPPPPAVPGMDDVLDEAPPPESENFTTPPAGTPPLGAPGTDQRPTGLPNPDGPTLNIGGLGSPGGEGDIAGTADEASGTDSQGGGAGDDDDPDDGDGPSPQGMVGEGEF